MSVASRLKMPSSVIQFLATADGQELVKYFTDLREVSIRQIRNSAATMDDIRYAQGAADVADKFINLKKDIQDYLDGVRTGKIVPPKSQEGEVRQ